MSEKKVKFGPIKEKMTEVNVEGQASSPSYSCLHDCRQKSWTGNSSSHTKGCRIKYWTNAHWSQLY
ncbi:hypothetical protein FMM74_022270 [Lachnospiraceae bacterium MD308]|nr:hypothetical protein [Lachnospiraceae bacterium MD308]